MLSRSMSFCRYLGVSLSIAVLAGLALLSGPAIGLFLQHQTSEAIRSEAEAQAKEWAHRLVRQFPEIGTILKSGYATEETITKIKNSVSIGGVFRFKLFADDGRLIFVSDQARFLAENERPHVESAMRVFQTGKSEISVEDGRGKPNRPETYVEAYIPAKSLDGRRIGVIEVYVDVTEAEQILRQSFSTLSGWLIFGSAIIFLIPAAGLLWRAHSLRQQDRMMAELQRFDQLTGVLNRNALTTGIDRVFEERAPDETIGVLFVDVDRFKEVNDTLGHKQGDVALRIVAQALRDGTRQDRDLLGRYGGDEFVVLLRGISWPALQNVVQRITTRLSEYVAEAGLAIEPTLSIGAHLSQPGEASQTALHAADVAVYTAKRTGRNRMVAYSEDLDAERRRQSHVEALLRRAIQDDLLTLHFQPIFDARSRAMMGAEALLRLKDPNGGIVSPGEFIPIAESCDLMDEIGEWTLRRAIRTAKRWPEPLFLSVNLSIAQFRCGDLPEKVVRALAELNFETGRLELEITESMLIEDEKAMAAQLARLREYGVRVAVDDFGAGATSVGHFWKFEFDKLKLDRSLLQVSDAEPDRCLRVLRSIVAFAGPMGCEVLAEGVEREDQLAMNASAGVDQIQGFLLGRPMPEEDIQRLVDSAETPLADAV